MRSLGKVVLAALALLMGPPAAIAQDSTPAAALPKAPVPYVKICPPRPAGPPPRSAQPTTAATPAAATTPPARHPSGARLASGQPVDPAQLEAFVDGWIADAMAREHVAGASVSVVQNGQVALKKGYGFADLAARRPSIRTGRSSGSARSPRPSPGSC